MTLPAIDFPVVFENDNLIVVSKPDGISSIPERGETTNDLLQLLSKHSGAKLFAVYLLDKSVTGLIVYAKNSESYKFLSDQFNDGRMEKTYIALLHGAIKEKKGSINSPLRKFGSGRMGVAANNTGLDASTKYEVMENFAAHTLVRAYPITNRRHQIRVHLFSVGHPIVGDSLYGDPILQKPYPRLLLHSHELEFEIAPGQKQNFTTPMPVYFGEMKKNLKK